MSDSNESDSQVEQFSDFYESSDSSQENGNSSDNEETETSSNNGSENLFDDDHEDISEWNYHVPKRNLKLFNDTSNISHQNYSKFRPIDFFKLLFTEQLLEMIWKQTNVYGERRYGTNWIPIEMTEITDNKKMSPRTSNKYSKTYKVDEFLEILQNNFKKNYTLGEHVSVDESMIKFKGRCSLKQYLPKKPIKRGFKIWTLADSTNGYVYDFRIYKGKDANRTTSQLLIYFNTYIKKEFILLELFVSIGRICQRIFAVLKRK
jgi:hypothetical protein